MADPFYPTVDLAFIENEIVNSGKILNKSKIKVGNTTVFVMNNEHKAMYKRIVVVRELELGQVTFEMATSLAIRLNFMGNLLKWLEENKAWKDGAYYQK